MSCESPTDNGGKEGESSIFGSWGWIAGSSFSKRRYIYRLRKSTFLVRGQISRPLFLYAAPKSGIYPGIAETAAYSGDSVTAIPMVLASCDPGITIIPSFGLRHTLGVQSENPICMTLTRGLWSLSFEFKPNGTELCANIKTESSSNMHAIVYRHSAVIPLRHASLSRCVSHSS